MEKKLSNKQLESRIEKALIHIDRTKDTREIYFIDKGLKITANDDVCLIQTASHTHVFDAVTSSGYSKPYVYSNKVLDIALSTDFGTKTENGTLYSFAKLVEKLKADGKELEYNIVTYYSWYLFNIFYPLYSIDENGASSFLVYFNYLVNLASSQIFLSEHKDGLTTKEFIEQHKGLLDKYLQNVEDMVMFEKVSDAERVQQEIDALQAKEADDVFNKMPDDEGQG